MAEIQEIAKEAGSSQDRIRQIRVEKANNLRERGLNPYPYKYEKTIMAQELQNKYTELPVGGINMQIFLLGKKHLTVTKWQVV